MTQFMLLLYDNPAAFANVTPEQMQQVIQEYSAWMQKIGKEGRLVGGEKLKDEGGKVLRTEGKQVKVVDGPYSETKEVIGGYFIINAKNYNEAVEVSKTCPHMKYGAKIEVREVDPVKG